MKIYKDLIINGTTEALAKFEESLSGEIPNYWKFLGNDKNMPNYLKIIYSGDRFPIAGLSIYKSESQFEIVNIIPLTQNQLSYDEYNGILKLFYNDFFNKQKQSELSVLFNENDELYEKDILKDETIASLKAFSDCANKSTGSIHPLDRKRWFDFICLAYRNGDYRELSETYLECFLVEDYGWSQEWALKLASEYHFGIGLLKHWEN
ncbi:hypothetical protein [uncultured Treponema sp.]|uniref:hypothetical protein n=1 Tax=uncultured Treponema sp. TaxID=162155 RepID=UPI0025DF0986|nr:hypothetical protein [uncultured Treponema sp.]